MKKYIFTLFTLLLLMFTTIALIRTGMNKSPLDIRKTWKYITETQANFDNLEPYLDYFEDLTSNLEWSYQSSDDPSFWGITANFFSNVGNFFLNIGKLMSYIFFMIIYIFGKIVQYFVYFAKIFYYLIS